MLKGVAISYSRDLPDPGLASPSSPALAGGFFTTRATWGYPLFQILFLYRSSQSKTSVPCAIEQVGPY